MLHHSPEPPAVILTFTRTQTILSLKVKVIFQGQGDLSRSRLKRLEVKDLQQKRLDVGDLHGHEHFGVDLIDVAKVRQFHHQARKQRFVVLEPQRSVRLGKKKDNKNFKHIFRHCVFKCLKKQRSKEKRSARSLYSWFSVSDFLAAWS
jgi:hypothetical protein